MDVGVRMLKARLSEYLARAARGEIIRVTDRGKPKAVLAPLSGQPALAEGLAAGWVTRESDAPPARIARRAKSKRSVRSLLAEDRGT
jgi:prevent-host-death family protein